MPDVDFNTVRTVVVLTIVAACFTILWPKIFYPMLMSYLTQQSDMDDLSGCCDVLFEKDINAYKIMTEMCGEILNRQDNFDAKISQAFQQGKPSKQIVNTCRKEVMDMCGIDIAEFLNKKEKLGRSYKHMLDEIRSFNISVCLRQNYGVNPGLLGAPRRMRIWGSVIPSHLRQERPLHFRHEGIHPALREKGRAIPTHHWASHADAENSYVPTPTPGMKPPMGDSGNNVSQSKLGATLGIIMPLYTIAIIIFFLFTLMKMLTRRKKKEDETKNMISDAEFRRMVFDDSDEDETENGFGKRGRIPWKSGSYDSTRMGLRERYTIMSAITGLVTEVDQELNEEGDTQTQYSTELKNKTNGEANRLQDIRNRRGGKKALDLPETFGAEEDEDMKADKILNLPDTPTMNNLENTTSIVKVVGMEVVAGREDGTKWNMPATPNLGIGSHTNKVSAKDLEEDVPEPQNIILEGVLPQQTQVLVTDSSTQTIKLEKEGEPEPPVILSSTMTLSLINCETQTENDSEHKQQFLANGDTTSDEEEKTRADVATIDKLEREMLDLENQYLTTEPGKDEKLPWAYGIPREKEHELLNNKPDDGDEIVKEIQENEANFGKDEGASPNFAPPSPTRRPEIIVSVQLNPSLIPLVNPTIQGGTQNDYRFCNGYAGGELDGVDEQEEQNEPLFNYLPYQNNEQNVNVFTDEEDDGEAIEMHTEEEEID